MTLLLAGAALSQGKNASEPAVEQPTVLLAVGKSTELATPRARPRVEHAESAPSVEPGAPRRKKTEVELGAPLSPEEDLALAAVARDLGADDPQARELAAREIRSRFGKRAAVSLLKLIETEEEVERRFRMRALVYSLAYDADLAERRQDECGWLGIRWLMDGNDRHRFAVRVKEPLERHPAASAGIQQEDLIVRWDGEEMTSQADFLDRVQSTPPGTKVALTVLRGNATLVVHVTLGVRRDMASGKPSAPYESFGRDMGLREFERWLEAARRRISQE